MYCTHTHYGLLYRSSNVEGHSGLQQHTSVCLARRAVAPNGLLLALVQIHVHIFSLDVVENSLLSTFK